MARAHVLDRRRARARRPSVSSARQTRSGVGSSAETSAPKPRMPKRLSSTTAPSMAVRFAMHAAQLEHRLLELFELGLAFDAKSDHPTDAFEVAAATASRI